MEYRREFQMMRNELGKLCGTTLSLLKEKEVEMSSFTFTLSYSFPELRDDLKRCTSLPEAMAEVIRPRVSLIQIDYLEVIHENFVLPKDSIDAYNESIKSFCNTMTVDHAYGQDLMDEFARHISKPESIAFTLDWEGDEHCLRDLLGLFKKLVGQYSKRVKVKVVFPKKSFVVQCYVPSHLQSLIVRMIQQNEKILHEENVQSVTAGGFTVFTKASHVSKSSIEVSMENITIGSDCRDNISRFVGSHKQEEELCEIEPDVKSLKSAKRKAVRPTVAEPCSELEELVEWEKTIIYLPAMSSAEMQKLKRDEPKVDQQKQEAFDTWLRRCPRGLYVDTAITYPGTAVQTGSHMTVAACRDPHSSHYLHPTEPCQDPLPGLTSWLTVSSTKPVKEENSGRQVGEKPVSSSTSGLATPTDGELRRESSPTPSNSSESSDQFKSQAQECRVGEKVMVEVSNGFKIGTVKFIGETEFAPGEWIGVALDRPIGKHNGTFKGISYFKCKEKHGIFVRQEKIIHEPGLKRGRSSRSASLRRRSNPAAIRANTRRSSSALGNRK